MGSEAASGLRKGAWTEPEDNLLRKCMEKYGEGKWNLVPLRAGLNRCRKSCRLRWLNYLRPNIKRGNFNPDEVDLIIRLHKLLGNRWSLIAGRLPGRTANDVKNYFNTHLLKKLAADRSDVRRSEPMTKTTIIRPQPRTLSRSSTWVKERPNSTSVLTNHNPNPAPSPTLEPAVDGSVEWLNNLTVEDEIMEQVITWPKNGLWPEETWSATKTYDDSCTREDPNGLSDVFSEELWDILKSPDDQVVM